MIGSHLRATYRARRERLGHAIGAHGVAIIPGGTTKLRNDDVEYPFRQTSDLLYLTGFSEPNAILVIEGGVRPRSTLFVSPKDPGKERWVGPRAGPEDAVSEYGLDDARPNAPYRGVVKALKGFLRERYYLYAPLPDRSGPSILTECPPANTVIRDFAKRLSREHRLLPIGKIVGEMRLFKEPIEIMMMERAAEISARAHRHLLSVTRAGMGEWHLDSEFRRIVEENGPETSLAYEPIVAAGENACSLHYTARNARIRGGDLVLVDAGSEYRGYASDLTRTFPASGIFSPEQRALYEVVLAAQRAAISYARAGVRFQALQDIAGLVLAEGLLSLGIIRAASTHEAFSKKQHTPFALHRVGHWLGLDVHDRGDYEFTDTERAGGRVLLPGMVFTVEPGLYIPRGTADVHPRWHGIGIRIEDDVHIHDGGNSVMTREAPKEIEEIEEIMLRAHGLP